MKSPPTTRHRVFLSRPMCYARLAWVLGATGLWGLRGEAQTPPKPPTTVRIDFGAAATLQADYVAFEAEPFSPARGYGWLQTKALLMRDRRTPDALRRDFVWGHAPATFRIAGLVPGRYKLTVVSGDANYGDHRTRVKVAGAPDLPVLDPQAGEYATLTATITCDATCDIAFDSPVNNWNVNALVLEPTTEAMAPTVKKEVVSAPVAWDVPSYDPTKALLEGTRQSSLTLLRKPSEFLPTKLTRADYLKLIASEVDFWKTQQNPDGAIIDPYRKEEFQYSTPAFAHAAAALVAWGNRPDLLGPAAKAMDWASLRLNQRQAASGHEDFYAPMLAHAFLLLSSRVAPERAATWKAHLRGFDPFTVYRVAPGASNWNVVSLSGEFLFQQLGIRDTNTDYVEKSLAAQSVHFGSPYGLYLEGPMAYDHFPRLWLADMLAAGYQGPYAEQTSELLRRAASTSLFMQSPWGELPAGGRSAHHQWNEAEQCATYETYAARAQEAGDSELAGLFKRAAHLALSSMQRWVRPSGEMQIVKNWVDPAQGHAFETYSAHSQYNLLPMSMLAIAYERSATTEAVAERPAPADVGGFVLEVPQLHKVFANAGGTYVELDTSADHHYDATGLIRVHVRGLSPQLGPSDSILEKSSYQKPADSPPAQNTGVGVSWQAAGGQWRRLGELSGEQINRVTVNTLAATPARVAFDVIYEGDLFGAKQITEHYTLTPARVELATEIEGYTGPLRYVWPVLADDGRTRNTITAGGGRVTVSQPGAKVGQSFEAPSAGVVRVETERYPNHNGWARLGVAEYPRGGKITLVIGPRTLP